MSNEDGTEIPTGISWGISIRGKAEAYPTTKESAVENVEGMLDELWEY